MSIRVSDSRSCYAIDATSHSREGSNIAAACRPYKAPLEKQLHPAPACSEAKAVVQVLDTELSDLGSLRTAPYLVMFVSSNFGGWLGDALITRQQYSVVAARRTVNSIGG